MPAGSSPGSTESSRTLAATLSPSAWKPSSARPPHRNSRRVPPLNFSAAATAITPMPPVRDTCVPPRADVEALHVNQPQDAFAPRLFAQRQSGRFFGVGEPNSHGTVFPHDPRLALALRTRDLADGCLARGIDGRRRRAEMETHRSDLEEAVERGRQHVLSGLLHVLEPAGLIDRPVHRTSHHLPIHHVHDAAVVSVDDLDDTCRAERAGIG